MIHYDYDQINFTGSLQDGLTIRKTINIIYPNNSSKEGKNITDLIVAKVHDIMFKFISAVEINRLK